MRRITDEERANARTLLCHILAANNGPMERDALEQALREAGRHIEQPLPPFSEPAAINDTIISAKQTGVIGTHAPREWQTDESKLVLTDAGVASLACPSTSIQGTTPQFRDACSHAAWVALNKFDDSFLDTDNDAFQARDKAAPDQSNSA